MVDKDYIQFDKKKGYPAGKNIFYECMECGSFVESMPKDSIACSCGNIDIDIFAGRVIIEDESRFRVFRKKQRNKGDRII